MNEAGGLDVKTLGEIIVTAVVEQPGTPSRSRRETCRAVTFIERSA